MVAVSIGIEQFQSNDEERKGFELVAEALRSSRRIIVVTGAGTSVSAGIPDFRSADGLYARVLASSNEEGSTKQQSIKGRDFFDAGLFLNHATRPVFNRFVAELRNMCQQGKPTLTHYFLQRLHKDGKLLRWYTQNIDGLEDQLGMLTSIEADELVPVSPGKLAAPRKAQIVALHGTLQRLICAACKKTVAFNDAFQESFAKGCSPECPHCAEFAMNRQLAGRRPVKCGILRPDIVLYNEPHPQGDQIAEHVNNDLGRRPTLLLVMGTSLRVVGLKKMVKDLARAVHSQPNGLVVYVNKSEAAPKSEWRTIFDYELLGECDRWMELIEQQWKSPREKINAPTPKKDGRIDQIFKITRSALPRTAKGKTAEKENENPFEEAPRLDSLKSENSTEGKRLVIRTRAQQRVAIS